MAVAAALTSEPSSLEATSRWGLLPFAIVLGALASARIGALVMRPEAPRLRVLFAMIGGVTLIVLVVRVLGAVGLLTQDALFITFATLTFLLLVARRDDVLGLRFDGLLTWVTAPIAAVTVATVATCACAAYWLPVWQWDALGYHLPYVNFALQRGSLSDVPRDVPYLSTYPHVVELFFAAWRAMLSDDRLVDAAQIPLGFVGAAAVACIARELGARRDLSVAAGLLWLTVPAIVLELPTNYIDVGSAAFLLAAAAFAIAPPTVRNVLAASLALGLFLGSKPNAPVGCVLVLAVLAVRGWRAGLRGSLAIAGAIVLLVGGESYVVNAIAHGNPVWPVRVAIGGVELPGTLPMQALLDSGAAAPRLHGPIWKRLVLSWTTLDAPPVFDMRFGGLGPAFLAALPVAVVTAVRRKMTILAPLAIAMLASPDPAVPRYVLAFPGLVLAVVAVAVSTLGELPRRFVVVIAAAGALYGFVRATPGITGEGPGLLAYASMSERERLRAVGADGSPRRFYDALERLGPEDETAFDASMDLPYLAWPPDLSRVAFRVPDAITDSDAERLVTDRRVRLFFVDPSTRLGEAIRAHADSFTPLFHCKSSSCIAYLRN